MHFGRVEQDKDLSLTLPAARERTLRYLQLPHQGAGRVYPAAPIWAERQWVGTLYPEDARPGEFLRYYAQRYKSVEYNGSFYRLPSLTQVAHWVQQVGPDFRFCAKVPEALSHHLHKGLDPDLLKQFYEVLEAFGSHAGLSFLQLPDWFSPKEAPLLAKLMQAWSQDWPLAIEFRHPAWFSDHMLWNPVIDQLYRHKMSAVITDTPGRRDVLHMSLCHPQVMVRFLGCFPSRQDDHRLCAWADRICQWSEAGLEAVYFFVHQARHSGIPPTVDLMQRLLLERRAGVLQSRH